MRNYFLALDTSAKVCSVALYLDNQIIGLVESYAENAHATVLPNLYIQLLLNAGIHFTDIQAIGFANGPGSYTGLRIGLASVKAMCWAHQIPLITYSSLESLAYQVQNQAIFHQADICTVMDARRMEVYFAMYNFDLQIISSVEAKIITEDWLADYPKKILFSGNGYQKWLRNYPKNHFIPSNNTQNSAAGIGDLLLKKWNAKDFTDWASIEPFYLKDVNITKKIV